MEFAGLLSGSDNFFKYISTVGLFMILISLVYPLQKKQDIQIEINSYNQEVELVNNKIKNLNQSVNKLLESSKTTLSTIDSLKEFRPTVKQETQMQIEDLQREFNEDYARIEKEKNEVDISRIVLKHTKSRIALLKSQSGIYVSYFCWLLISGIVFSIIGFIFWAKSAFKKEKLMTLEIKKNEGSQTHNEETQQ